jgi:hypothetical protein
VIPADNYGTVELAMTATNPSLSCVADAITFTVEISQTVRVDAGSGATICTDPVNTITGFLAGGSIGGSADEGSWSFSAAPHPNNVVGAGITITNNLTDPSSATASGPANFIGDLTFTLTATDNDALGSCPTSVDDSFTATITGPLTQPLGAANWSTTWEGDESSEWHNPNNWTNCVPEANTVTTINDLIGPNDPVISVADGDVFTIEIQGTSVLEIQDTPTQRVLTVHGP